METSRKELEIQSLESWVEFWLHQELCDLAKSQNPSPSPLLRKELDQRFSKPLLLASSLVCPGSEILPWAGGTGG